MLKLLAHRLQHHPHGRWRHHVERPPVERRRPCEIRREREDFLRSEIDHEPFGDDHHRLRFGTQSLEQLATSRGVRQVECHPLKVAARRFASKLFGLVGEELRQIYFDPLQVRRRR